MRRDVFNAIADPTRREILISLSQQNQNVNTLADRFDMSRQAVSLHLKYLQECGVVSVEKVGRERNCSIEVKKLMEIEDWLIPFRKLWEARFLELDSLLKNMQNKKKLKK